MFAIYALSCLLTAGPEIAPRRHVDSMLLNNPDVVWSQPDREIVPIFLPQKVLEKILPADPNDKSFLAAAERLGLSASAGADLRERLARATASPPEECDYPIEGDIPSGTAADLRPSFEEFVRARELAAVGEVVEIVPGWIPSPMGGRSGTLIHVKVIRPLTGNSKTAELPRAVSLLEQYGSLTLRDRLLCTHATASWQASVGDMVLIVGDRNRISPGHFWGNAYPIRNDSVSPGDIDPDAEQRQISIRTLESAKP